MEDPALPFCLYINVQEGALVHKRIDDSFFSIMALRVLM